MEDKVFVLKDESRISELIELFQLGLGETKEVHWKWRLFTDNDGQEPEVVVMENAEGKLIGMATIIPVAYGNQEYKGIQLCDWVVHPDFRGQGIIGRLYRYMYTYYESKGYDFLMAFPNENSYPILVKYGFEDCSSPECWNSHKRFYLPHKMKSNMFYKGYSFHITDTCPIQSSILQREGRLYRTPKFLRWKYDLNPDTEFKWLSIWKDQVLYGYFVFTQNRGRINTAVNVYDWDYWTEKDDLFVTAIKQLKQYGNYVSIWGKYDETAKEYLSGASLQRSNAGNKLVMKAMSKKGCPPQLILTRIDTDF